MTTIGGKNWFSQISFPTEALYSAPSKTANDEIFVFGPGTQVPKISSNVVLGMLNSLPHVAGVLLGRTFSRIEEHRFFGPTVQIIIWRLVFLGELVRERMQGAIIIIIQPFRVALHQTKDNTKKNGRSRTTK